MPKPNCIGLIAVVFGLLSAASAQYGGIHYSISIQGEKPLPLNPGYLRDYFKSPAAFAGEIRFGASEKSFLAFHFAFPRFKLDGNRFIRQKPMMTGSEWISAKGGIEIDEGSMDFIRIFIQSEGGTSLYGITGIGFYRIVPRDIVVKTKIVVPEEPVSEFTIDLGEEENRFAFNVGLGIETLIFGSVGLFGEAKYHYISTKVNKSAFTSLRTNGNIGFWAPCIGLRLNM